MRTSLSSKIANEYVLYDYATECGAGASVTYALAHSIELYHFIVADLKFGQAIVSYVLPTEALLQSYQGLSVRQYAFINGSISNGVQFYKGTNYQITVHNELSVGVYVRFVGVCPK